MSGVSILIIGIIWIAGSAILEARNQMHPPYHKRFSVWQDYVIWPFLAMLWEPFSRKNAHGWHWKPYDKSVPKEMRLPVEGDPNARERHGSRWRAIWETNFGWKTTVILRPRCRVYGYFRIGFIDKLDPRPDKCKMLCSIPVVGRAALLVGKHDVCFFAVDKHGHYVPLEVASSTTKKGLPPAREILLL